jgi:hypothetical protein
MFIFDASTLILAAKMEKLELFLDNVELDDANPLEVEKECAAKRSLDALMIQKALDESRIRVVAVKKTRSSLQNWRETLASGGVKRKPSR